MHISSYWLQATLLLASITSTAAASWTFTDATILIQSRNNGVADSMKAKLAPGRPLSSQLRLGASDTLKLILTVQDDKTAKRPNQAALILKDTQAGLDVSYPLSVKENGKATISLAHKDLPSQFQRANTTLQADLVIASFGPSAGYKSEAFSMQILNEDGASKAFLEKPLRYGKLPEIHYIFRSDPKSGNILISAVFAMAAMSTLPVLIGTWLFLGGNVNHLSQALNNAPVSHAIFLGSLISLEGILFLYYSSWNLFQTLPALTVVGSVAFVSGSRALTEVQERRLAGLR